MMNKYYRETNITECINKSTIENMGLVESIKL